MVVVRSVPHIVSAASGMMVPSWLRGPRGAPTRVGARRSCSRMSRSTRRLDVRRPATRSRAQTFRVTFAVKGAGAQDGTDRLQQGRIRHRPNRTRSPRRFGPRGGKMAVDGGPRGAPDPAHAGQAIGPAT